MSKSFTYRRWYQKVWKFFTRPESGRCANCGEMTTHFDYEWDWFICGKRPNCTSQWVSSDLAEHVMHPNGMD